MIGTQAVLLAAAGLATSFGLALVVWAWSLRKRDVSVVDIAWGALVVSPAAVAVLHQAGPRAVAVLALAATWALRLGGYIAWRHRGQPEDRRYRAIRERHEPGFAWKSLYLVFGLQAILAWIVSAPLVAAVVGIRHWNALDAIGIALVLFGLAFETTADTQLAIARADPARRRGVMRSGLWRYSRHPNYFGEFVMWWGFWVVALAAGAPWSVISPLLMTGLLLKVSGVTLLEQHMSQRPGYEDYMRRTSAFFPWKPRE